MTHSQTITLYLFYTNDKDIQRTCLDKTIIELLIIYPIEIYNISTQLDKLLRGLKNHSDQHQPY